MQDRLQVLLRARILECQLTHSWAIQGSLWRCVLRSKAPRNLAHRRLARSGQGVRNLVGVHHAGAEFCEQFGNRGLPRADPSSETDRKWHCQNNCR